MSRGPPKMANSTLARQRLVKDLFAKALASLTATDGAAVAEKHCNEALSADPALPQHERDALTFTKDICQMWSKADIHMVTSKSTWSREEDAQQSLECYRLCQKLAALLHAFKPTVGYFGQQLELDTAVTKALEACVDRANDEIRRKVFISEHLETGKKHLDSRRTLEASQEFDAAKQIAENTLEAQQINELMEQSVKERRLQLQVKQLFGDAIALVVVEPLKAEDKINQDDETDAPVIGEDSLVDDDTLLLIFQDIATDARDIGGCT